MSSPEILAQCRFSDEYYIGIPRRVRRIMSSISVHPFGIFKKGITYSVL